VKTEKIHIKNISTHNIKLKVSVCNIYLPIDHSMTNNWWILTDKDRCSRKCRRCKGPEHRKRTQKTTKWNLPLLTSRIFSISGQWSSCYVHDWLLL